MRLFHKSCLGALALGLLAPSLLAGGRNPGSVLVYTVQRSGPSFFTVISVTNSNTAPSTPMSTGGSTNVHFEYVNTVPNPADACIPLGCTVFNRIEFLTPADTLSVVTKCHNAFGPGGQQGYLVVSAQDPTKFDTPWSHNYLMGSAIVVNGTGGMYSVNAIPFNAIGPAGDETDTNANGQLDFNDFEYEKLPDVLYIDSFVAIAGSSLAMINFEGGPSARNVLAFQIWNDNEIALSATKTMGCWFDVPLTTLSPLFAQDFLANNTPDDPQELDINCDGQGDLETGWARINSIGVFLAGGQPVLEGGFPVTDGALLGSITAGPSAFVDGGHLLWESVTRNAFNGSFPQP